MIKCPYCGKTFSSSGSYRVYKYRFHRGLEYKQPIAVQEEVQQPTEPFEEESGNAEQIPQLEDIIQEDIKQEHHRHSIVERGKGSSIAIIAGLGAIAVIAILAMLEKKQ